jgi:CspA family cold shock protein
MDSDVVTVVAEVRVWHDEEGWGVLDSLETPGGCFVSWAHIDHDGYRSLGGVSEVLLDWEAAPEDGYPYCAVRVRIPGRPTGTRPSGPLGEAGTGPATDSNDGPDMSRIAG